jgi:hypothetical protein
MPPGGVRPPPGGHIPPLATPCVGPGRHAARGPQRHGPDVEHVSFPREGDEPWSPTGASRSESRAWSSYDISTPALRAPSSARSWRRARGRHCARHGVLLASHGAHTYPLRTDTRSTLPQHHGDQRAPTRLGMAGLGDPPCERCLPCDNGEARAQAFCRVAPHAYTGLVRLHTLPGGRGRCSIVSSGSRGLLLLLFPDPIHSLTSCEATRA